MYPEFKIDIATPIINIVKMTQRIKQPQLNECVANLCDAFYYDSTIELIDKCVTEVIAEVNKHRNKFTKAAYDEIHKYFHEMQRVNPLYKDEEN